VFVADIRYGNLEHFDLNKPRTELIYAGKLEYPILKTRKTAEQNIKSGEDLGGITDQGGSYGGYYMSYLTMVVQCGGLFL
jgi:hypothetical protein